MKTVFTNRLAGLRKFRVIFQRARGSRPSLSTLRTDNGFTLVEILIVVVLVAILAVVILLLLNPTQLRERLYDVNRKRDLNNLRGLYEIFHNQHFRYPTGAEICYDTPVNDGSGTCSCHICGLESANNPFTDILQVLYCDPQFPRYSYLYEYDCSPEPLWYRMYAQLSQPEPDGGGYCTYGITNKGNDFLDPSTFACDDPGATGGSSGGSGGTGGGGGTGPTATPTPTPMICPADPTPKYCILSGICNICGTFAECNVAGACDSPDSLYSDSYCTSSCSIP